MVEMRGHSSNSSFKRACGQWALIRRLDAVFSGETKLTLMILGPLCTLVGVLAFAGAPAQATVSHEFLPE
jgi:hypothetical protein